MYKITTRDGAVLYDVSYPDDYMVTEPKATLEVGQPGSLQFSLVPEHPLYGSVKTMETYVCALKENVEFFYGRIIDINVDQTTGIKQIECAGALQFLEDAEIPPVRNQNAQQGEEQGVEMTASAFFTMCINSFNSDINNDAKRALSVGTISHSKASKTRIYNIGNYTQVKSALDSNLIAEYGGYFRIRKSGNNHLIDWLEEYGEPHTSPIQVSENVLNQENAFSANELFTLLRPIGKDDLMLPEVVIPLNDSIVNKYGRIIHTEVFSDAENESDLRSKANEYISMIGHGLGMTATIKVVDLHFLDNDIPAIRLASTYTNISGFVGEEMVVAGMELHFANPANDSITLKNKKELLSSQKGGTTSRGTLSKASRAGGGAGGFQNIWEHITETEDSLSLHAKLISINAENLVETANEFERYSRVTDEAIETLQGVVRQMEGTGVFQNNDHITQIAGSFSIAYYKVPSSKITPTTNPRSHHWYVKSPYTIVESDIGSGREFFNDFITSTSGPPLDTSNLTVGQSVVIFNYTTDTTPGSGTVYYTKGLALSQGTDLTIDSEGSAITVAKEIIDSKDDVDHIKGSALWTQQDYITGVVGEFEIRTDPKTGERRIVIKSGGGISVEKDHTEFGLYSDYDLTAGVIVDKINDPNNTDKILGTRVDIKADQVKVGSTSNVEAWMNATGENIDTLAGLIADKATIGELNSLLARIQTIEADYITTEELQSMELHVEKVYAGEGHIDEIHTLDINGNDPDNFIVDASVSQDGKTLTLTKGDGTPITFSKPASTPTITLSPSWSGKTYKVTAVVDGKATSIMTAVDIYTMPHADGGNHMDVASMTKGQGGSYTPHGDYVNLYLVLNQTGSSYIAQIRNENSASSGTAYASLDVSFAYNDGYNAGYDAGHLNGLPSTGTVGTKVSIEEDPIYNFSIKSRDDTSTRIQIDCTKIYTAARKGYTLGTFTQATVTLQGAKVSVTPIKTTSVIRINSTTQTLYARDSTKKYARGTSYGAYKMVDSGGTVYYRGNGGGFTIQGAAYDKLSLWGNDILYKLVNGSYVSQGSHTWYYQNPTTGTQVYKGGSTVKYDRGGEVRFAAVTAYPGDGGEFYPTTGKAITAYPKLSSGGTLYYQSLPATSYYQKGTDNSTDYYTKS